MPRATKDAVRARGSLAIDPKTNDGAWESPPERVCAWDEDETTLAIQAARHLPRAPLAVLGPGIDPDTFRMALDVPAAFTANDPMGVAMGLSGPVLAVGSPPGTMSAVAALVDEGEGPAPAAPRDVSPPPHMVPVLRAMQEARRVPPTERVPDSPMGAYVPLGTWLEDLPARLRLVAQRCEGCARVLYPPRGACPACRGRAFSPVELPREAEVYAATRIGRGGAPSEFALEQMQVGAYWVAVVAWPDHGVRVTARLAGFDERAPEIGQRVVPIVRRLFEQEGTVRYGVKFGPGDPGRS